MGMQPPGCYCKSCRYDLRGSVEPVCPECGLKYDPADPRTYLSQPNKRISLLQKIFECLAIVYPLVVMAAPKVCYVAGRIELGHWPRSSIDDPKIINIDQIYATALVVIEFAVFVIFWSLCIFIFSFWTRVLRQPAHAKSLAVCLAIPFVWPLVIAEVIFYPWSIWTWFFD